MAQAAADFMAQTVPLSDQRRDQDPRKPLRWRAL